MTTFNRVRMLILVSLLSPSMCWAQKQIVSGDSRSFFSTLYEQNPEVAKKVVTTAALCGFPVTPDTAMKLLTNDEFTRLGNSATEVSAKCNSLLAAAGTSPKNSPRSNNKIAPETALMQALSGLQMGGMANGGSPTDAPRRATTTTAPVVYATPTSPNGEKREVEGANGWSGYVVGVPSGDALFAPLKIGMGNREVMDLIGPPTDQGMHVTGKAWIPYFGGAGKTESWMHYKGVGRLLLSQDGGANAGRFYLIGIEHDAKESGYQ